MDFRALSIKLLANYDGKIIRLTGSIKTENMSNRGITGTTDWTAYEITLPLKAKETEEIIFGGLLVGKGKMWLDGLDTLYLLKDN